MPAAVVPACRGLFLGAVTAALAAQDPAPATRPTPPDLSPAILVPAAQTDGVIARAGPVELTKAHVYDRLLESDPRNARRLIDLMVLDALIAEQAKRHQIRVDPAQIEVLAAAEEKQLRTQVEKELAGRMTFAEYLGRQLGMTEDEYRRWLVLNLARKVYREYVARYLATVEDRVQVRYLVTSDAAVAADCSKRARVGADFASLALKFGEDESRQDGGLLPPFGKGFRHPVAGAAFQLQPGQVSDPVLIEQGGGRRWYVVYCLKRMPGRQVGFAEVRAELDREMTARPMTPFEFDAFYLQLRGAAEKLPSTEAPR